MAEPAKGGRGHKSAQEKVLGLREEGKSEEDIRRELREVGYKTGRVSQLLKLARPPSSQPQEAQPARVAAPPRKRLREKTAAEREEPPRAPAKKSRCQERSPVRSPWKHSAVAGGHALRIAGDAQEVEEELAAHAASVRPWLQERQVDGDGHFTAARQNRRVYEQFFARESFEAWLQAMAGYQWADDPAVQACCDLLGRPFIIYRKGSDQPPTIKTPETFEASAPFLPVYKLLDETRPGCEHYGPLGPGRLSLAGQPQVESLEPLLEIECNSDVEQAADPAADAADRCNKSLLLKRPAAKALKKPAGRYHSSWAHDNFDKVKQLLEQGVAKAEIQRRLGGDKGQEQIRRIEQHIQAGTRPKKPKDLSATWRQERDKNFCVLGVAAKQALQPASLPSERLLPQEGQKVQAASAAQSCSSSSSLALGLLTVPVNGAAGPCRKGCDLEPAILESAPNEESQRPSGTLAAYVTPLEKHWCDVESGFNFFQALSSAERAFHWLRANNTTYERYVDQRRSLLRGRASQEQWRIIPTAQLLLGMPGIEVAARPWLYPTAAFSDTDLRPRLLGLGRITNKQKPSLKTSFTRKLTSRCQSYQADFPLFALLHDIALARQVSGMVKAAEEKGIAPDEAASGAQNFSAFWALERAKLEDVCRQRGMPNLFFTIAPAEWKFPLHEGMFGHCGAPAELEKVQATLALHMRHVLKEVVEQCVLNRAGACKAPGVASVLEYSLRFEFQEHCLLRYVSGYVSKSSDALEFKRKEWSAAQGVPLTHWRQTYRLLCKQAPLEPEMALHLAGAPLMESSYRGATVNAPLPWNSAKRSSLANNQARVQYLGYLAWSKTIVSEAKFGRKLPFSEWLRLYSAALDESGGYTFKERGAHGAGSSKEACAVGVVFSFELLDIFVGQFCATCIPHTSEDEFAMPESEESKTPEGARFLAMALKHPGIRKLAAEAGKRRQGLASISGHDISDELTLDYLLNLMVTDLRLRGLESTGKTEVVAQAALDAAQDNCKVLIACPTGVLVAAYRERLQGVEGVAIETVHASFKITRDADAVYVPPGRLRRFDLIVFDETSQLDDAVWQKVQTALAELSPGPFTAFVGDFQQLQPVAGQGVLQQTLQDAAQTQSLKHIELQQHKFARSKDPKLLDFLSLVRVRQPTRQRIQEFFGERRLPENLPTAVRTAAAIEARLASNDSPGEPKVTFLTVTNKEAKKANLARLQFEFPEAAADLEAGKGLPGDAAAEGGRMIFEVGMRIRLTRNLDKDRGFVNGALGTIEIVLRKDVFL
ncbi:unnamed protein product, partial [Effrenium voratum]